MNWVADSGAKGACMNGRAMRGNDEGGNVSGRPERNGEKTPWAERGG